MKKMFTGGTNVLQSMTASGPGALKDMHMVFRCVSHIFLYGNARG